MENYSPYLSHPEVVPDQELQTLDHFYRFPNIISWYKFCPDRHTRFLKFLRIKISDGTGNSLENQMSSGLKFLDEVGCIINIVSFFRMAIQSPKNLWSHPKFRSGGISRNLVFRSRQKLCSIWIKS